MVKFLAGASFVCIAMVLAGVNRGFDISDEGLYVLLADPHQQNVSGIFNYDLFFKLIFRLTGYSFSLVELRLFRLLGYLAGAFALAGFWKNIKGEANLRLEIFLVSFLALMSGYAFLPPTLSYNSLAVVLICFWLQTVSYRETTFEILLCMGVLLGLLVYVKITLMLLFVPLTFLILWKKVTAVHVAILFLPLILSELVLLNFFGENAFVRLLDGISLNYQRPGYQVGLMLKSVAVGGVWIAIPGVLFFALGYLKRSGSRSFYAILGPVILTILALSYFTHITDEWNHLVLILSAGLFGFCLGFIGIALSTSRLWIVFLFLVPFLMHFGSNVYWLRIGIHYWVFWLLAFLLCFETLKKYSFVFIPVLSVLLVFNGIWYHPFGLDKPLWSEKKPWSRGKEGTLQLDPELIEILNNLKETGIGNTSNPILAVYRIPGIVWLVGIQFPHSPGIWDRIQLTIFSGNPPERMIYNQLDSLPADWSFSNAHKLGVYQGDSLILLWN